MSIELQQNTEDFMLLRAAIYKAYSAPKFIFTLVFYVTLILVVATIANNLLTLKWDNLLAGFGFLLVVIEAFYRPFSAARLTKGAILGDMYDLGLYGVPLPPEREREQLLVTEIVDLSRGIDRTSLIDWYQGLARFPQERQPLACQLTNAVWDFYLRRYLQLWTLIGLIIYLVLLGVLAWELTFQNALLKVFLPGAPFALMLLNLHVDSRVAIANLQGLKNNAEQALRTPTSSITQEMITSNQRHLFKHRQTAFPIPNVINKLLAKRTQAQVSECLNALARQGQRP